MTDMYGAVFELMDKKKKKKIDASELEEFMNVSLIRGMVLTLGKKKALAMIESFATDDEENKEEEKE